MNRKEFSSIVQDLKKTRPIWFGLESDPEGTDSEISEVEKELLIRLPKEYKEFVQDFGGGYFGFTNVFSVNNQSEWYIVELNRQTGLLGSHSLLIISDNQTGDYFGFNVENGVCSSNIMFYDHETNQIEKTDYNNLYEYLLKVGLNPN